MQAEHFRRIRVSLDLTTQQLADVLNVTVRAIQYWESGAKPVNPTAARVMGWLAMGFRPPEWPK